MTIGNIFSIFINQYIMPRKQDFGWLRKEINMFGRKKNKNTIEINGRTINVSGNNIRIANNHVYVDGKIVDNLDGPAITIVIEGNVEKDPRCP